MAFNQFTSSQQITVGNTKFILPEGYHHSNPNDFGAESITNNIHTTFLTEYNGTNITKYVEDYQKFIKTQNQTMNVENFTIDNITLYKTVNIDNPHTIHYFFVANGNTFDVYTWDGDNNIGSIALGLAKSATPI